MSSETIFTNAVLVLPDEVVAGTLVISGGTIVDIASGPSSVPGAIDLDGDYLIPGVVDVHTDNLERQVLPRTLARWPSRSAMVAHDAQCAAAGVTTILDALCLGDLGFDPGRIKTFHDGVADLDALTPTGLLKSQHYLHLRCEIPALDTLSCLETVADHPLVRMISLMDHSPGVGQYANIEFYRNMRRRGGLDEISVDRRIAELQEQRLRWREPNRRALLDRVRHLGIALASHDDRTVDEIAENARDGIRISEFPVTMEAAQAAKAAGMDVIAGAPNVVRGGSHSGNIAAADLLRSGWVDVFASDYVPPALIEAAFRVAREGLVSLPGAMAMIASRPAELSGLPDRGRLATGLRADLVRVRVHETLPVVRQVWCGGERVI
jgi:alpha-D-ribose 1-methylphosphonate 5-triphosphate diphosphatase